MCWRLLAAGCPVDTASHAGDTPLGLAASHGHVAVTRVLLDAGARVDVGAGPTGATPLHRASGHGHTHVVRALLGAAPGAVDAKDAGDWTPLMRAAAGGHPGVCRLLVARGADVDARNQHGHTATEVAGKTVEAMGRVGEGKTSRTRVDAAPMAWGCPTWAQKLADPGASQLPWPRSRPTRCSEVPLSLFLLLPILSDSCFASCTPHPRHTTGPWPAVYPLAWQGPTLHPLLPPPLPRQLAPLLGGTAGFHRTAHGCPHPGAGG